MSVQFVATAMADVVELRQQLDATRAELTEARRVIDYQAKELTKLQRKLEDCDRRCSLKDEQIKKVYAEWADHINKLEAAHAQQLAWKDRELEKLKKDINVDGVLIASRDQELDDARARIAQQGQELMAATERYDRLAAYAKQCEAVAVERDRECLEAKSQAKVKDMQIKARDAKIGELHAENARLRGLKTWQLGEEVPLSSLPANSLYMDRDGRVCHLCADIPDGTSVIGGRIPGYKGILNPPSIMVRPIILDGL